MKKNEVDFSSPVRQSYIAILLIIYKTIAVVIRQIIPLAIVILIGSSKNKSDYLLYAVVWIALLTMIYSILNYFKTYFYIKDDDLIFHTGVFTTKKLTIPFTKIQTINFEQNLIHQLFDVVKLKIDTAGSEKNEFEFHALDKISAHTLREKIISLKQSRITLDDVQITETLPPKYQQVMHLNTADLIKIGLTENHLRSGGLIFLFFFWIYQNLGDAGIDLDEYAENNVPEFDFSVVIISFLLIFFLIVSVSISLGRSVFNFFDLNFVRAENGFKLTSGLFTKKEVTALDHKIQFIAWSDNLLRKLIGFKNLSLNQASSKELTSKQNIKIPGCQLHQINAVVKSVFGINNLENIELAGINSRYFIRFAIIITILMLLVGSVLFWLSHIDKLIYVILFWIYLMIDRWLSFKKTKYGYDDEILYIKNGKFGDKDEVIPIYKIQALELLQSPYQAKNKLCNLVIFTAAGQIKIPYISFFIGKSLMDRFLYKIEHDSRPWM